MVCHRCWVIFLAVFRRLDQYEAARLRETALTHYAVVHGRR